MTARRVESHRDIGRGHRCAREQLTPEREYPMFLPNDGDRIEGANFATSRRLYLRSGREGLHLTEEPVPLGQRG